MSFAERKIDICLNAQLCLWKATMLDSLFIGFCDFPDETMDAADRVLQKFDSLSELADGSFADWLQKAYPWDDDASKLQLLKRTQRVVDDHSKVGVDLDKVARTAKVCWLNTSGC